MASLLCRRVIHAGAIVGLTLLGSAFVSGPVAAGAPEGAAAAQGTPEPRPQPGDVLPAFDTVGIDGKAQHVSFGKQSKTVLLFFNSGCPHCHKMIPEWNKAYQSKPAGLNVYGVMLDKEPPGFFILMPIDFPVLRSPGKQYLDQIKQFRVPTMVRVGGGGKIEDVVVGIVDRMRVAQIFKP